MHLRWRMICSSFLLIISMRAANLYRLLLLAAIWGASFLFMRVAAPALGFVWTAQLRAGLAGVALLLFLYFTQQNLNWRKHWRDYAVIGVIGSALPFVFYAYAALKIPAGYSAIVNSTSPLWSVILGVLFWRQKMTWRLLFGLCCGIAGVALLVRLGPVDLNADVLLGVFSCTGATLCYALAGEYSKRIGTTVAVPLMAAGSQLAAALVLLPAAALTPLPLHAPWLAWAAVSALALLGSALAYLLYFKIVVEIGPMKALTVTFLIPVFALFWGWLLLDEQITSSMVAGCVLVVTAMGIVGSQKKV